MIDLLKKSDLDIDLVPVILSGGTGSRLWPLSRESFPKQYLKLNEDSEFSLLQETYLRLKGLKKLKAPIIVCNENQRFIVAEQMREINISPNSIILEPFGKNTAPAVTISALLAKKNNEDPLMLILSSDHLIENKEKFHEIIKTGIPYALNNKIVTFGIVPSYAETGYGYIESKKKLSEKNNASQIKRFIEKPNSDVAQKLIKDSHFSWNSGIFLFKASTMLNELERLQPNLIKSCSKSLNFSQVDLNFTRLNKKYFLNCPNIPIDIAVMEKTNLGTVVRFDADWKDLGSWKSVWENSKKDIHGNSYKGNAFLKDSNNCYVRSENRLVVTLGVKDLVVVETDDAVLISNKLSTQALKEVVKELEEKKISEGKFNRKIYRPWGSYTSVIEGSNWQVKKLEIKPNASLSLQMHQFRSEHWVVVNGTAKVELEGKISLIEENESTYIPIGWKHRLTNPGDKNLIIIEVQSGTYLGEDDIIRFDDIYGRDVQENNA